MNLKHAKSNFKLLIPFIVEADRNQGTFYFKNFYHSKPDLVIENLISCEYRMFYEGDSSLEAEFSVDYHSEQIIPIRYFNLHLNVFDNSRYWKTTYDCFFEGNRNLPNVNALIEVDALLWKWISDLPKMGYRAGIITNPYGNTPSPGTKDTEKTPPEIYSKEVSFDNNEHTLFIRKGTISCERKNHKILSATGILVSLR